MRAILLAVFFCGWSAAGTITLTMDELPFQPVNGLTVSKGGLNFSFTNPALTLDYDALGPGILTFLQDPSIEGTVSQFSVAFSAPVSSVQFGMAEISGNLGGQLATVELFNGGSTPFSTTSLNSSLDDPFPEAMFSFSAAPVTSVTIIPSTVAPLMAFDNLTVVTGVPEPESIVLAAAALTFLAWKVRDTRPDWRKNDC